VSKGSFQLVFDQQFQSENGFILGAEMVPLETETACLALMKEKKMKVSTLHGQLGHAGEEKVCATAKMMKWHVTGRYC